MAEESFEKSLQKLESIVDGLESGDLALDDMLKKYEEGVSLVAKCTKVLSDAEKKIAVLSQKADGTLETQEIDSLDEGPKTKKKTTRKKKA